MAHVRTPAATESLFDLGEPLGGRVGDRYGDGTRLGTKTFENPEVVTVASAVSKSVVKLTDHDRREDDRFGRCKGVGDFMRAGHQRDVRVRVEKYAARQPQSPGSTVAFSS